MIVVANSDRIVRYSTDLFLVYLQGSSQKFPASTCLTTAFYTIYTSVKLTSFTNPNESVADMMSL